MNGATDQPIGCLAATGATSIVAAFFCAPLGICALLLLLAPAMPCSTLPALFTAKHLLPCPAPGSCHALPRSELVQPRSLQNNGMAAFCAGPRRQHTPD